MHDANPKQRSHAKWPVAALVPAAVASIITAGTVSWATTPDGNLVVTLVPALVVGLAVFGLARWRLRRGGPRVLTAAVDQSAHL